MIALDEGGDLNAPGGAITVALCGHWDHPPPCPLAPHHTAATEDGEGVRLRILFAANAIDEVQVRTMIEQALASGRLTVTVCVDPSITDTVLSKRLAT